MGSIKADTALVAYVPSPHAGYVKLFKKYRDADLYVLGRDLIEEHQSLVRHLPGNDPVDVRAMIGSLQIFRPGTVGMLSKAGLGGLRGYRRIVMPDEDVSRAVAKQYLAGMPVEFDGSWRLRWDWGAASMNRRPEGETIVSRDAFDRQCMRDAHALAARSPDWWRQIGAMLVYNGSVVLAAFNRHMPSEQSAYLEGDPRSSFSPGEKIDCSLALHAEMAIVAEAARRGISTAGCDLYVTTFPCPPCANACASLGLRRLYYVDGYSLVAGADALRSKGVEIIRVEM
jgi:dCMP deaminase